MIVPVRCRYRLIESVLVLLYISHYFQKLARKSISIILQSLRLYGLPEAAPAVLNGTPLLTGALFGSGRREFAAEVCWDLPNLAPGATSLLDVTVNGAQAGDLAQASLVSSTRFIELDAAVWSNNTVRVMARNISAATFDLAAATLSVGVVKRRVP